MKNFTQMLAKALNAEYLEICPEHKEAEYTFISFNETLKINKELVDKVTYSPQLLCFMLINNNDCNHIIAIKQNTVRSKEGLEAIAKLWNSAM